MRITPFFMSPGHCGSIGDTSLAARDQSACLGFVELDFGASIMPSECIVEMEALNGAKMKMDFSKRATTLKVLMYDGHGFWLCQKRLSRGRFRWWPQWVTEKLRR